jgi:hypothetical protein
VFAVTRAGEWEGARRGQGLIGNKTPEHLVNILHCKLAKVPSQRGMNVYKERTAANKRFQHLK